MQPLPLILGQVIRQGAQQAYGPLHREADRLAALQGQNILEIHHRIPLEYRRLFDSDPNRLSNLIGLHKDVHAEISGLWTSFRLVHPDPSPAQIVDYAALIDRKFGIYFNTLRTSKNFPSFR